MDDTPDVAVVEVGAVEAEGVVDVLGESLGVAPEPGHPDRRRNRLEAGIVLSVDRVAEQLRGERAVGGGLVEFLTDTAEFVVVANSLHYCLRSRSAYSRMRKVSGSALGCGGCPFWKPNYPLKVMGNSASKAGNI